MGQYFIPTIFRKESNVNELYARYDEEGKGVEPTAEKPVAALLSHNFKVRYTGWDGKPFTSIIGLKFMEHCYIGNPLCRAVEYLLANEYSGCPVVWGGDYSDYELFQRIDTSNGEPQAVNAYMAGELVTTRTFQSLPAKRKRERWYRYLINHDTEQYVAIPRCKKDEYQIHPLPVLTCDSYTGGFDKNPLVGIWKGHHLSVSNERPPLPYRELTFEVKEEY